MCMRWVLALGVSVAGSLWDQPTFLIQPESVVTWRKLYRKMSSSFQTGSVIPCVSHLTHSSIYWVDNLVCYSAAWVTVTKA